MKGNDKTTYDQQCAALARYHEDAVAKGHLDGLLFPARVDKVGAAVEEILVTGIVLPLKQKYLNNTQFKFGGAKKKSSNSGGCGAAGRRKKNPRFPSGLR